ncbi:MAG: penicillin-binding protein [Acidobacteriaceae bacterium]|nr:penicillin-binding protein [Acidobacteriaceae bacterium]
MNKAARQTLTAPIRRIRFVHVAMFFCAWVGIIGLRLVWLQVIRHHHYVEVAARQQQRTFEVAPRRGMLYDRNLRELAMTVLVDSVYAVPSELGENREEAAEILSQIVHADPSDNFTSKQQMLARFTASRNFAWVARRLDSETADRVRELNLKGVYFQKEFKRFYPNNDLAAQVLGYVGTDDEGLGGLERKFDDDLHGQPGHMLTALDAKRHVLGSEESEPMPGENLVLTIDANIQYMAEKALDDQMAKTKALHGTVVVMDPHTGQVLALAVAPRFNPNDQRHMDADVLNNLAVSNIYEPGSTFKLVAYSAAIDAAGVEPDDIVDCQGGAMTMYGRTLHDDKADHFGRVTVQYALEHSSDVGAAKMALKLGPEKFYSYMKAFGFGDRSGIELPSETRGLLRPPRQWGATSILSLSIGQEIGVTPVQLAGMVSTIANGGTYLPPHILLQSTDQQKGDPRLKAAAFHPQNELPAKLPDGSRRVISEMTAAKMRRMMQGTVVEGTGKAAALNGYSAGGKTGTAQKIDVTTHTYSKSKYVASFAGMAPVSNPAITVAVVIDSPSVGSYYGAAVSAPVFQEVAQQVLEYLGVPHDEPLKTTKEMIAAAKAAQQESAPEETGDLNAMFAQANELPADDPIRAALNGVQQSVQPAQPQTKDAKPEKASGIERVLPAKVVAAFKAKDTEPPPVMPPPPPVAPVARSGVVVSSGRMVAVPVFTGQALRQVVQSANGAGLRVQTVGSGIAREQAPPAGTMVPQGTQVVVRFSR